mmetsp:Transcript_98899/g.176200  ORF Transcript_98899/g.176200 Transcript_98899/m.176200 type:complete len:642 (+) Transcript_98899:33-1958(+)
MPQVLDSRWYASATEAGRRWSCRRRLEFPATLIPGQSYSLPLFLDNAEAQDCFLADEDFSPCKCFEDKIYEALDHKLFWLGFTVPESGRVALYLYSGIKGCEPLRFPAQDILAVFEDFRDGIRGGTLKRWSRAEMHLEDSIRGISTEQFLPVEEGGIGQPTSGISGSALWLDTSVGHISLISKPERMPIFRSTERLHVRVHFFDDGDEHGIHWLGCTGQLGAAAVGVMEKDVYSVCHGKSWQEASLQVPKQGGYGQEASTKAKVWRGTCVQRAIGWHVFEMIWEKGGLKVLIDTEPIAEDLAKGPSEALQLTFFAAGGNCGVWAGLEVFHTPNSDSWKMELLPVKNSGRYPWQTGRLEVGCWQFSGAHVLEIILLKLGGLAKVVESKEQLLSSLEPFQGEYLHHPAMDDMLGYTFRIVEVLPDGMVGLRCLDGVLRYFPPAILAPADDGEYCVKDDEELAIEEPIPTQPRVAIEEPGPTQPAERSHGERAPSPVRESDAPVRESEAPVRESGVVLECWSKVDESDLERVERAVKEHLEYFSAANIIVPDNLQRVGKCSAEHKNCFVYRFGSRKIHMSTRVSADGRLSLVVRCGGGFMDFIEFVRRHGSLEQLKLQGPFQGTARFSSVLSGGRLRVRSQAAR